ncbi:MAG: ribosome recycling factor, partial [Firmicutes bacterium]|nr:ribosome recycling factor [Bacillota bacterium]
MSTTQDILKDKMSKTMSVLKTELNTVRAGRANAALLDQIVVPYWGVDTPLKQLANITVPD